jgi:hypothetical protein
VSLKAFATSRTARLVLSAVVVILTWQAWLSYQAAAKMPADLSAHLSPRETVDLKVTLRFPPERFHTLMMQRFGRVSGTEGDTIEVRGVSVDRVWKIARLYWVRRITPFHD